MRSILIALTTLAASAFLPAAAGAECLPSAEAVRAIHGQGAWSSYHHVQGKLCYFLGERHTKQAARTPVPRQRPVSAPPIRTIPQELQHLLETTEAAPPAPVQIADLAPNQPLRNAMETYVVDQYWVLMWRARN